jgi:hypothetical protein
MVRPGKRLRLHRARLRRARVLRGLITDINLGDGPDGWEVAKRGRELIPTLPVVYMSGASGQDWPPKGVPHSTLLAKPFAPAQHITAISVLLNTRTSPQSNFACPSTSLGNDRNRQQAISKRTPPALAGSVTGPKAGARWPRARAVKTLLFAACSIPKTARPMRFRRSSPASAAASSPDPRSRRHRVHRREWRRRWRQAAETEYIRRPRTHNKG